jgi:phage shock protein E
MIVWEAYFETPQSCPLIRIMTLVETFLKLAADARTRTWEIPVDEVPAALDQPNAILIDVREEEEWREGHIKGAVHLSRGIIEFKIQDEAPDLSTPIVLYCGRGRRSALVADNLQKMGYNNVITIAGGFEAWQNSDLPSETAPQSSVSPGLVANQKPA